MLALPTLVVAMSNEWSEIKVADLLSRSIGGVWGEEPGGSDVDVRVYRSTDFNSDGRLSIEKGAHRSITGSQLASRKLEQGDILLEKSGGGPNQPVGRVVFVSEPVEHNSVCANFVQLLRPDTSVVVPKFLFYSLWNSHNLDVTLEYQAQTTGIRNLRTKDYLERVLSVPPLSVQRRIVDLMSHLDAHIANLQAEREAINALLDSLRHSFLGNLVVDGNLEKVVTTARAGGTPDRKNLDFYGGDIPWLKSGEVGGSTIQETEELITLAGLEHSSAWLVPADTTLVAMYGATAGVVGYTAIPLTTNQAVLALVADSQLADSRFLFHWMTFLSPQLKAASTGAAQANLSKQVILRESGFPDINVEEQSQIASLLDSTLNKAECLEVEQLRLTELRKCLLADLLSGTEELDDAYDSLLSEVA